MLMYKNLLINRINSNQAIFFQDATIEYVNALGFRCKDFYEAAIILRSIDDNKFTGEGASPKGKYFLYDQSGTLHWFVHYRDACMFAGLEEGGLDAFIAFRRHWKDGFLWLLPEDVVDLDELLTTPKGVYCETKGFGFETVDDAARWLVNAGYAKSAENAKKQLVKHLEGKTALCYKMKFIEY